MVFASLYEKAIAIPFEISGIGSVQFADSQEKIWADRVLGAVGTLKGQRLFIPNYGTEIPDTSMETIATAEDTIKREIESVFINILPTLVLISVDFVSNDLDGQLTANVTYTLPNKQDVVTPVGIATISSTSSITEAFV